uniref:Uncharacterized protein n=1 Tax=Arion vulgaris TaxID=1028688 RepID=A0A0B7BQ92_9EUPU
MSSEFQCIMLNLLSLVDFDLQDFPASHFHGDYIWDSFFKTIARAPSAADKILFSGIPFNGIPIHQI